MSDIDITRRHDLSPARARTVIEHIAESLEHRFGVVPQWDGDTLRFARSGVDGFIAANGNQVHVNARLGPLLTPLRPMVESEIRRKLDEYFSAAG